MFRLDIRGEEELWHAAKLMELVILHCIGKIDDVCTRLWKIGIISSCIDEL